MAETKNYVSKYSGDQLDAAIAVLGSLGTMFFSQADFNEFKQRFNTKMDELEKDVGAMKNNAQASLNAANAATAAANAATARLNEIASKQPIIYEVIPNK